MAVCEGESCVVRGSLAAVAGCEGRWCTGGSSVALPVCERVGCEAGGSFVPMAVCEGENVRLEHSYP